MGQVSLPGDGAKALAHLVRSTSQRPLTVAEARDKLVGRDHDPDVVEAVIAHAGEAGLLDDRAFADAWVNDRGVNRGYGRDRLQRELRRRKVDDATIDAALGQLDEVDEVAQATELARQRAQRMPASTDPQKVAQRLVGFLMRRGFGSETAHQVARQVTALDRDWD
ncbi:regulatory protein RecX [Euzebya sp.]|uniref:regulatory protein RecX n=1 Tax=Euzebya sp. TaxID=1971409 RepID=UPI003517AFC1